MTVASASIKKKKDINVHLKTNINPILSFTNINYENLSEN